MDRRVALQRIGALMGGALSASTIAGVLGGCSASTEGTRFVARTLTNGRDELVGTVAELIIPETDTPGARVARVHEFIDNMLTDWYDEEERSAFLAGLSDLELRAAEDGGDSFLSLNQDSQIALLTSMEEEAYAWQEEGQGGEAPFFNTIKSLTLFGYYTSEVGATQELRVMPMGEYRADVPFDEIGRAWA